MNMHVSRYVKFVLYLVICINWMSCAVYITACPPYVLTGLLDRYELIPSPSGQQCLKESWLESVLVRNTTLSELYATSAYFAIVTFMGVGFGDFHAKNVIEVTTRCTIRDAG